jgi:segregation and condensation protein B
VEIKMIDREDEQHEDNSEILSDEDAEISMEADEEGLEGAAADSSLDEEEHADDVVQELAADGAGDEDEPVSESDRLLAEHKLKLLQSMRLEARIEAVIFASQKPLKALEILDVLGDDELALDDVQSVLDELIQFYEDRVGGFRLKYIKRLGYQFQTAPEAGPIMERMFASRPRPISRASMETLSIIAYRQPVTRAQVEFVRGVDAGSIFKTLVERGLVKCVGRKEVVGRPMLFGTTDEFLKVFNLTSLKDLPSLESFQPAPETIAGSKKEIEGDEGVDIEQYIAENTEGEALSDEDVQNAQDDNDSEDLDAVAEFANADTEGDDLVVGASEESTDNEAPPAQAGATAGDLADEDFDDIAHALADDELSDQEVLHGATAAEEDHIGDPKQNEETLQTTGIERGDDSEFDLD